MADGEVIINTKLDTSGLDKGLKDLKISLKNLGVETSKTTKEQKDFNNELDKTKKKSQEVSKENKNQEKSNKSLNETLKGIKSSTAAAAAGYVAAGVAIKKTVDALNDCEAAYKVQLKAETALANAAKNNPYLNNESVYNLRAFASELQSMSEIGDEQSLQVMAQLAAMGRTEEQIQAIMKAAADMSAVTGNSIQNIAVQLNKTYSGLSGELGEANSAIRALSKEELEAGKAIDIIAQQYKGSAAAMADQTVQLQNAWGDFKENIGRGWNQVTQPVKQFFLNVLNDINEVTSKTADLKTANAAAKTGEETASQAKLRLEEAQALLDQLDKTPGMTERKGGVLAGTMVDPEWQKKRDEQAKIVDELTKRYNFLAFQEEYEAKQQQKNAEATKKANDAKAEAAQRDQDALDHINANQKALAQQIQQMELKAKLTGEEVDAGEMYNAYMQSYIDLVTKSNGLVTENNSAAQQRLALVEKWAEKAKNAADEEERLNAAMEAVREAAQLATEQAKKQREESKELMDEIYGDKAQGAIEKFKEKAVELADLRTRLNQDQILSEAEKYDAMKKLDEEYAQAKKELYSEMSIEISGYMQNMYDVVKNAADLARQNTQTESDLELAKLEEKYDKGLISEEEYYAKQKEIKKKAAQEEYKISMFEWTASMLAATANIAEGVTKAIAQGGITGIVTGALVAAAGAVQIASITASRPTPPSFYTGGIIGGANGATMGGDNTYIHARRGEMILNAAQQRSLWDKLNGQSGRLDPGLNLTVNNTQAGRVDTQIQQKPDGEYILNIIDKRINKGLSDGVYDPGFSAMNSRQEGVSIL